MRPSDLGFAASRPAPADVRRTAHPQDRASPATRWLGRPIRRADPRPRNRGPTHPTGTPAPDRERETPVARRLRFADAAQSIKRRGNDGRPSVGCPCQALAQPFDERGAAFEQAAEARIGEKDRFGPPFLGPRLFEYLGAQRVAVGEPGVVQPLLLDVLDKGLL